MPLMSDNCQEEVNSGNEVKEQDTALKPEIMDPAVKSLAQHKYSKTSLVIMRNYALSQTVHPCIKDSERPWRLGVHKAQDDKQSNCERDYNSPFKKRDSDGNRELGSSRNSIDQRCSLTTNLLPAFAKNRIGQDISDKNCQVSSMWKNNVSDNLNGTHNRLPPSNGPANRLTYNERRRWQNNSNKYRNTEPEWFSCSVSKDDLIELHGFDDSYDGIKHNKRGDIENQPNDLDSSKSSQPLRTKSKDNRIKLENNSGASFTPINFDSLLNVDPFNNSSLESIDSRSRFSKWFDRTEDPKNNLDEKQNESKPNQNLQAFLENGQFVLPPAVKSINNCVQLPSNQKKPSEMMKSLQELEADMRKLNSGKSANKEKKKFNATNNSIEKTFPQTNLSELHHSPAANYQPIPSNVMVHGVTNVSMQPRMVPPMEPYPIQLIIRTQNDQLIRQQQIQSLAAQTRYPPQIPHPTNAWGFNEFGSMQHNQPFSNQQFTPNSQAPQPAYVCMPLLINEVQTQTHQLQQQHHQQIQHQYLHQNQQHPQHPQLSQISQLPHLPQHQLQFQQQIQHHHPHHQQQPLEPLQQNHFAHPEFSNYSNQQVKKPQMTFASEIELDLIKKQQQRSYEYSLPPPTLPFPQTPQNFQRPNVNLQQFFQQHQYPQNLNNPIHHQNQYQLQPQPHHIQPAAEISGTVKSPCIPLSLEEFEKKLFRNNPK